MQSLFAKNELQVRPAEPGEFTARAYLNGKMDLTQAEAVNEVIASSNRAQLAASERLLQGRLAETTSKLHDDIMDCLSLIEAGLDFSTEDIEFITRTEAVERLTSINSRLRDLIAGSITYEEIMDLPSVGIAGATNAGKSSLLNKLLGTERSIVSSHHKTTRDILTSMLTLDHCSFILFDCAGLIESPDNILDELAQQAAIEALAKSSLVLFCVDASKNDYYHDIAVRNLIRPINIIAVATKTDLLSQEALTSQIQNLNNLFETEFIPADTKTQTGLNLLRDAIDNKLLELAPGSKAATENQLSETINFAAALTARHKNSVTEAAEHITTAIDELEISNDEVAAMMLRASCQSLSGIEQQNIDDQILQNIFQHFCIGK
jgi:tRNA modification GTPase